MALTTRKPRKIIKIGEAAKLLGCSSKTIKRGLGNFQMFKLNDALTSPHYLLRQRISKLQVNSCFLPSRTLGK